jgi:hypothetical protein
MKKDFFSRLATLTLGLVLVLGVAPRPAHAIFGVADVVTDPGNTIQSVLNLVENAATAVSTNLTAGSTFETALSTGGLSIKEYVLDQIAFIVGKEALGSLTDSIVDWVATGFDGSPAIVTNLQSTLLQTGDTAADSFLGQLASDGRIDSPFRSQALQSARTAYYQSTGGGSFGASNPYTLNQNCANSEGFNSGNYFDFSCWMGALQNPFGNTPTGSGLAFTDALFQRVNTAQGDRIREADWGNGYWSYRESCNGSGSSASSTVSLSGGDSTYGCPIRSPGTDISATLQKSVLSGIDQYVQADEMNEIIGALISSLVNRVLTEGVESAADYRRNADQAGESGGGLANVVPSIRQSLVDLRGNLTQFKQAWERIKTPTDAAVGRCPSSASVSQTAQLATTSLAKANTGLTKVTQIEADLAAAEAATANRSNLLLAVSESYNSLMAGGTLPTPAEMVSAQRESQETQNANDVAANGGSLTLYSKMTRAAAGHCPE